MATETAPCVVWAATIVTRSGRVELLRSGTEGWVSAKIDDVLCHGDMLKTGDDGDVVLRTPDLNEHRILANGHVEFLPPDEKKSILIAVLDGILFALSQDSRALGFWTRFANGGPEGTEFIIGVSEDGTEFAIVDGIVLVATSAGTQRMVSGDTLRVAANGLVGAAAPEPALLPWAYFPPVVAGDLPSPAAEPAGAGAADFFVRRAAARLEVGAVDEALADLDRAAALDAADARVDALRAIVAQVAGDQARAEALAASALRTNPDSVEALLASSHVWQTANAAPRDAQAAAIRDALRAREIDPGNGLAWTRLAEAYLADERYPASADAAFRATQVAPDSGEAFTALGFARYAQRRLDEALAAFERAKQLGAMSPHVWHGTALVLWQQGRRDEAREAAEVALILDPRNVGTRSALAKFYDAEERRVSSAEQLAVAERLTPTDPTPLLVRSYIDQSLANPIAALREFNAATGRNAGRPPTHSTQTRDPDRGTGGFGWSRIFIDTDTLVIGNTLIRNAFADNPLSPWALQLGADLAGNEPFGQMTAVNEAWQQALVTPSIETPASFTRDLELSPPVRAAAPRVVTTPDVDVPLNEDGVEASVSALRGSRGNEGLSGSVALRGGRRALGFAFFDNQSNGYRPNQDSEEQGRSLRFKWARDPGTSGVVDVIGFETEKGDTVYRFFDDAYGANLRFTEDSDVLRLGLRHDIDRVGRTRADRRETVLFSVVKADFDYLIDTGFVALRGAAREETLAARYVLQTRNYVLDVGASFDFTTTEQRIMNAPATRFREEQRAVYAYVDRKLTEALTLTLGVNFDDSKGRGFDEFNRNGKAALAWDLTGKTTWRIAYAETPAPPVASTTRNNGQPDLERTRVAGFKQLTYPSADRARTRWTSIEHEFSENLFGGIEAHRRSRSRPLSLDGTVSNFHDIDERVASAHLYWLASDTASVAAVYERDSYSQAPGSGDFTDFSTRRTIVDVNVFLGSGISASIRTARVHQRGNFMVPAAPPGISYAAGHSAFTTVDAGISFRLPNRRTTIDLRLDNVTDERFRYQEPEYDYPTFVPARTLNLAVYHLRR